MIKAVLFDLDGTLLDTNELIFDSFNRTIIECVGVTLDRAEVVNFFGRPLKESFGNQFGHDNPKIDEYIKYYRDLNEKNHDNMCSAFEGVKELLTELKNANIKIGIVTSKRGELARRGMEIAGIIDFMDVIISPESTELHKPNPEPAIEACRILGVDPTEALMVGDASYDILCGNRAGCRSVAVSYSFIELETLKEAKPHYIIDKPLDILDLLNK